MGEPHVYGLHDQCWRALLAAGARFGFSHSSNFLLGAGRPSLCTPAKELISAILGRSLWTDYIWNEARVPVRVVLFHDFGRVRRAVPLQGSVLSRLLKDILFQRDREWSPLFLDFTDISPTFSTEHELGVLASLRGKRDDVFRFLKNVVA